jgi:hypothetical protein
MWATSRHEDQSCRNADRVTAVAQVFPPIEVDDNCVETVETWVAHGRFEVWPQGLEVVTIRLLLEFLHLLCEAIGWNESEQLKLRKHFDRMVEEVPCNLKVVERSEATGEVLLERPVQKVVSIIEARHGTESMRVIRRQER